MLPFEAKVMKVAIWPEEGRDDIDTDIIMGAEYLKVVKKDGLGPHVFDGLRFSDKAPLYTDPKTRQLIQSFFLNKPENQDIEILIVGKNFGCGSSREHAVWGLMGKGIKVIIAESFAPIFYNNAFQNGLLLITLERRVIDKIIETMGSSKTSNITVNLSDETLQVNFDNSDSCGSNSGFYNVHFKLDALNKRKLLEGLDDVDLLFEDHQQSIVAFNEVQIIEYPWIQGE